MKYLEIASYHNTQIVSTAVLKQHLRITFNDDDSYIVALESAAVRSIEEFLNMFLLETDLVQYGNRFSDLNILYKSPALGSTHIVKYMSNGSLVNFTSSTQYIHKIQPPRLYAKSNSSIPSVDDVFQAWQIEYKVGYSSIADIPDPIIQAIMIMVSDLYENRQSVIVGKVVNKIPRTAQYLMNQFKIQTL